MEHVFKCDLQTAIFETTKGKVRGYEYDGISIFKGIPYAKAARFHAPEPVKAWENVFDATNYGYVCPLLNDPTPNGELGVPHRYWVMNEDCQNLNVWTPACDDNKRPVMVWLHGGGFKTGSAIEHIAYEGENMCRFGQVVVVSINHRLNVLGYCDLSAFGEEYENSGNVGTEDIIAALKWIQENIARFGGDSTNVTLFGQSGGGEKITTLLQTPAADGLYAKGICMSGVLDATLEDSEGSGEDLIRSMMADLGTEDVKTLEQVPYGKLATAYNKVAPELQKAGKYVGGNPLPNAFYKGNPLAKGFRQETANIPMIISTVFGELISFMGTAFMNPAFDKHHMTKKQEIEYVESVLGKEAMSQLLPLFEKAYPEHHVSDLLNIDILFRKPTQQYIRQRSALNEHTFSCLFNQDLPFNGGTNPWHCSDIPYVFHNTKLVPVTQEIGVTEKLEKQIFESVIAFAKTGNPNNSEIPEWPSCTPQKEMTMIFDANTRLLCNHDKELLPAVVKYVGPILGCAFENVMGSIFGTKWKLLWGMDNIDK